MVGGVSVRPCAAWVDPSVTLISSRSDSAQRVFSTLVNYNLAVEEVPDGECRMILAVKGHEQVIKQSCFAMSG